jgi:hypothetical protein
MKGFVPTLLAMGAVLGAAFAAAETLTVASGGLQSGAATALTCDANGVHVAIDDYNDNNVWDRARVSGIDCTGKLEVGVEVLGGGNVVLAKGHADVSCNDPTCETEFGLDDLLTKAEIEHAESVRVAITQK